MKTIEYVLPDWTLSPLFYADETGISDEESEQLDAFVKQLVADGYNGNAIACEELGFTTHNDLNNLGGECHRVTFQALTKQEKNHVNA